MTLDERVERSAKRICCPAGCEGGIRGGTFHCDWTMHAGVARFALVADAPEIAAAKSCGKIEGLTEAVALIRRAHPYQVFEGLRDINARIAAIEFAFHARPKGVAMFHPDQEGKAT